jgi:ABC-type bacteriocin/lantibiotic exporter with double-glycine peptidase domain
MPALSKLFIDHVLVSRMLNWVSQLLSAMFLLLLMVVVLTWMKQNFLLRFETAIESTSGFMWHLLRLPADFFNQRFAGDISSRVALNDLLAELLSGEVASNVFSILAVIFFAIVMSQYDFRRLPVTGSRHSRQTAARLGKRI